MYAPQYFTLQRLQEILLWSYLEGVFNNNYFLFIFQACLNDIQEVISLQHPQALSGKLVNLQKFCQRKLSSSQHLIHGKYWCFLMLSFTFGLLFCTILTECNCICSSKFYFRWGYFTEYSHCYRRTTQQNSQWIQFDWNQLHSQPGTIFEGWLSGWHNTNKFYKMGKKYSLAKIWFSAARCSRFNMSLII